MIFFSFKKKHGETALIISVWHGFPKIVHILGEVGAKSDLRNKVSLNW